MSAKTHAEKMKLMAYAIMVNGRSKRDYSYDEIVVLAEDIGIKASTAYNLLREGSKIYRGIYSIRNLVNKYVDTPCHIEKQQGENILKYGQKFPDITDAYYDEDTPYEKELDDYMAVEEYMKSNQ